MKKRLIVSFISLFLVFSILITGCVKSKTTDEDLTKEIDAQEAKVKPYKVEVDLSNIENLKQFGEFSKEQLDLLVKNNFVVNPTKEEQLFYIYEDNEYKKIPSFITTDLVLQVYHIFYDYTLRTLESERLLAILEELTDKMLKNSLEIYNEITNDIVKKAQLKNIAYFAIPQLALEKDLPEGVPEKAKDLAYKELEKIMTHSGFMRSDLFPYDLDYSQFTIRGHYTRSKDFERYFRAMMWYGQAPFPLYFVEHEERNVEQTLQALLIAYSLNKDEESYNNWGKIYEPTNFL